jgi:DNA end-binding protein Ku
MAAEEEAVSFGGRTFWSGTISFGLVSVPVALFAATRSRPIAMHMVAEDGHKIERRYVCSKDGKELDSDDIVRGYEVKKGKFIVVSDEELEAVEPRKSREIDLKLFVPIEEIEPQYFRRAYYLAPAGGGNKAYRLLADVMERTGRAGVATFVMRAKEYLVAIVAEDGILRAETLRFHDEIRTPEDVGLPKAKRPKPAQKKRFADAIARKSRKLDLRELSDEYAERLEKLVAAKERKRQDVVKTAEPVENEEDTNVVDLMAALRSSLGASGGRKGPRRSAPRKKTAAKKSTKKR